MSSINGASENCLKGLTNRMNARMILITLTRHPPKLFILSLDSESDRSTYYIYCVSTLLQSDNGIHIDAWYVKLLLFNYIFLNCDLQFDNYNIEHL